MGEIQDMKDRQETLVNRDMDNDRFVSNALNLFESLEGSKSFRCLKGGLIKMLLDLYSEAKGLSFDERDDIMDRLYN